MSLLFIEGFDDGLQGSKWNQFSMSLNTANQRTGTTCGLMPTGNQHLSRWLANTPDTHVTFIVGFAMKPAGATATELLRFYSDNWGTIHDTIYLDTNNRLTARRGSVYATNTILGQTSNNIIVPGSWQYVEVKVTLSATVGVVNIRLNGGDVLNLTGQNTKNGGTNTVFEGIAFWDDFMANGIYIDDLYICNGAGSVNNDFLGDCSVQTLYPNGNGNYSQWVGSDGDSVNNYQLVNEAGSPVTTTYVETGTLGNIDTYAYADLVATTSLVRGVAHRSYIEKTDTGAQNFRQVARIGGTNYPGSDVALGTSFGLVSRYFDQSPATAAAWLIAEVNGAEFGVENRTSTGPPTYRASSATNGGGTANTASITVPAAVQTGDLMVAMVASSFAGTPTWTVPSGWTSIQQVNTANLNSGMWYKIAAAGDLGATLTWSNVGGNDFAIAFAAYSGVVQSSPVDVSSGSSGGGNINAASVTTTLANDLVVYGFAHWANPNPGNPTLSGASAAARTQLAGPGARVWAGFTDVVQASAGASATETMTTTASQDSTVTAAFKSA
jgi:hypothetical protein